MLMRLFLAVTLSAGLLLGGTGAAVSQALMAGSQSLVICSPDGVHEIMLGANGEPITVTHHCVECCLVSMDGLAANWPEYVRPYGPRVIAAIAIMQAMESRVPPAARARAPPVVV